jgi:hypothetical protein
MHPTARRTASSISHFFNLGERRHLIQAAAADNANLYL